jgi:copper(I)-binding protein
LKASRFIIGFFILLFSTACQSRSAISIQQAWARPAKAGENSAVYFVIDNPTSTEDVLLAASADVSSQTELHMSMTNEEGTMSMHPQDEVVVPARSQVEFKPGGLHVMLIGLQRDLQVGDRFALKLKFRQAGEISVDVEVKQP